MPTRNVPGGGSPPAAWTHREPSQVHVCASVLAPPVTRTIWPVASSHAILEPSPGGGSAPPASSSRHVAPSNAHVSSTTSPSTSRPPYSSTTPAAGSYAIASSNLPSGWGDGRARCHRCPSHSQVWSPLSTPPKATSRCACRVVRRGEPGAEHGDGGHRRRPGRRRCGAHDRRPRRHSGRTGRPRLVARHEHAGNDRGDAEDQPGDQRVPASPRVALTSEVILGRHHAPQWPAVSACESRTRIVGGGARRVDNTRRAVDRGRPAPRGPRPGSRPRARRGARGGRRRGSAPDPGVPVAGPSAPPPGSDRQRQGHPRGGHPRWLQHHLPGPCPAGRWRAGQPRARPAPRRGGARQHRTRGARRRRRRARRPCPRHARGPPA